jgi:hypothetical protein
MISQSDAPLITPRREVRICYNEEAVRRACKQNKQQLKKCGQKNLALPEQIELAIGMKVKETTNMETNIDIANKSRGEIVGIVFEEGEASTSEEVIQEIPLVKLARTRLSALQGLPSGTEDNKFSDRGYKRRKNRQEISSAYTVRSQRH